MRRVLVLFTFFKCFLLVAQPPLRFYTAFGDKGEDAGYSVLQALDNQYIIAGSSSGNSLGGTDAYLVKLDTMGNIIWQKFYGGIGNEVAKSIIQTADSGYVFTGFSNSIGMGGYDAYTVRVDKFGNVVWQKTFGGLNWDFATDIVQASDGNIIVVGYTESIGAGKKDGFIIKYDLLGNLIWQKLIGGQNDDELRSVIKTNDNFLAAVGYISTQEVNGDMFFMKFDLNGDTIFTKTIGGSGKDYATDLVQKANNQYVICGAKTFTNIPYTQSYMHSFTSIGTFTWENNYYSSFKDEEIVALTNSYKDPDYTAYLRNVPVPSFKTQGNIFVGRFGGWAVKVNSYGGSDEETFYSLVGTKDGGYVSVGRTSSFSQGSNDVFFIKLDSTVITYSNVVSIKSQNKESEVRLIKREQKVYELDIEDDLKFLECKIIEIGGRTLRNVSIQDQSYIDLGNLVDGYYILEVFFANRPPIYFKIINQ